MQLHWRFASCSLQVPAGGGVGGGGGDDDGEYGDDGGCIRVVDDDH